ncbi:MAG: tetratricopeptide repeat protein [Salinibacter sp.]
MVGCIAFRRDRCRGACTLAVALLLLGGLAPPRSPAAPQSQPTDTTDIRDLRARKLFVRGMTQSYLEDYEEAVSLFKRALEAAPRSAAILSALSDVEARRENFSSALYYARQARRRAPATAYYHLELARLHRTADQSREAVAAYQRLLERFPDNTTGRLALARLQSEQGRPRRALRHYEALMDSSARVPPEAYPEMLALYRQVEDVAGRERILRRLIERRRDASTYRRRLGQLYIRQERPRDAIAVLEPLLREHPRDPRLLSRLKRLYTETGQPEKAKRLGAAASEGDASPDQLVARARMLYERRGSLDSTSMKSATELLRTALDQVPDHGEALALLGRIYYDRARYGEAASLLRRALDANPRDPDRWRRAASAYLRADSLSRAVRTAEEGLLLFPGRVSLLRIQGEAHLHLNEPAAARDRFREALEDAEGAEISPRAHAALHVGVGRALEQTATLDSAAAAYEAALRIAPEHRSARTHLARVLARQETQLDRALRLARRAVDQGPATPETLGTLGWVLSARGDYPDAASAFERALAAGAPAAWVYERFGDVQRALGNDALARQYWKRALKRTDHPAPLRRKLRSVPQS